VGWLREEIETCGAPFDDRGRRVDEQLAVMRALWEDRPDGVTHHGAFFDLNGAMCDPKPHGGRSVPIHIGGHSRAAARRAGRVGDGFQPLGISAAELPSLISVMRDEAAAAGRDPDVLELSLGHAVTKIDAERVAKLAAAGADRLVLAMPSMADIEQAKDALSACAARLALGA
jgi:alkanesulfonate monooxygenase SsuD/methylene tetrahydromethanopterin reductase-like flavin-dependent oxidoreductase (luciferase family)